jgi:hypothetical protein
MSDEKKPSADVKEVEFTDMDDLLGTKAATVMVPDEESKKSVLESTDVDSSFLDNDLQGGGKEEDKTDDPAEGDGKEGDGAPTDEPKDALSDILGEPKGDEDEDDPAEPSANKGGRKGALIEAMGKLEEKGIVLPFKDAPDWENYSIDEIVEAVEANISQAINTTAQNAPMEIFSKLDPKLQEVVAYNLNGGSDMVQVLKNVTRTQEITNLDVEKEEHHERIVREWLRATNFGTDEEVEDEITAYVDRGELDKKARQFKPKLDKKSSEIMQLKLQEQEQRKAEAEEASKHYAQNIHGILNNPHLNGLPLNNRIQTALYYGITDTDNYQDREGNSTNELGYLIEQYQAGENANPAVLLEALWLLKDPQGYRETVFSLGQQAAASNTFRELQTAEGSRKGSSSKQGEGKKAPTKRTLPKKKGSRNIFGR